MILRRFKFEIKINKYFFISVYVIFIVWICVLRPFDLSPIVIGNSHDSFNIHRLLFYFPPVLLILFLYPILFFRINAIEQFLVNILFIGLCIFLIKSMHSEPSVWWSRRYLTSSILCSVILFSLFIKYKASFSLLLIRFFYLFVGVSFFLNLLFYYVYFIIPFGHINFGHKESFENLLSILDGSDCKTIYFIEDNIKHTEALGQSISSFRNYNIITNYDLNILNKLSKSSLRDSCVVTSFPLDEYDRSIFNSSESIKLLKYNGLTYLYFRDLFKLYFKYNKGKDLKYRTYYFYSTVN